jgi:hypothetical protein
MLEPHRLSNGPRETVGWIFVILNFHILRPLRDFRTPSCNYRGRGLC